MKYLNVPVIAASVVFAAGCSVAPIAQQVDVAKSAAAIPATHSAHEAILLVSLDDGSVVMQKIESDADVCFKVNSESSTTCLAQGEPIIDPGTNSVIGYEMIEMQVDLYAKTH